MRKSVSGFADLLHHTLAAASVLKDSSMSALLTAKGLYKPLTNSKGYRQTMRKRRLIGICSVGFSRVLPPLIHFDSGSYLEDDILRKCKFGHVCRANTHARSLIRDFNIVIIIMLRSQTS